MLFSLISCANSIRKWIRSVSEMNRIRPSYSCWRWTWRFRNCRQTTKSVDTPQMISMWEKEYSLFRNPPISVVILSSGVQSLGPNSVRPVSSGPESSSASSRTRHPSASKTSVNFPTRGGLSNNM